MSLSVCPGDCYRIHPKGAIPHFFFVISAPDRKPVDSLVLVPMTSVSSDKNIDDACLLAAGDHHTCTKPSFMDYRRAVKIPVSKLESLIQTGVAVSFPPPSGTELLARLRNGAEESEFMVSEIYDVLYVQGLVRPY